jgi:glycosyltransferase involved in cell wall biosynthesis
LDASARVTGAHCSDAVWRETLNVSNELEFYFSSWSRQNFNRYFALTCDVLPLLEISVQKSSECMGKGTCVRVIRVAIVGPFKFPTGEAASSRVMGLCGSLLGSGVRVDVVSGGFGNSGTLAIDALPNVTVSHFPAEEIVGTTVGKLRKLLSYLVNWGGKSFGIIGQFDSAPDLIVVYGGWTAYALRAVYWRYRYGTKIAVDVVEWYDGTHMVGGRFGAVHASAKFALRFLYPRFDGIVCISEYLERYYAARSKAVILRVPPTVTIGRARHFASLSEDTKRRDDVTTYIFAGNPGKKELLANILSAFHELASEKPVGALRFVLVGISENVLAGYYSRWGDVPGLEIRGRLPQEQVWRLVAEADYSVLFREDAVFSRAGFSTKFVESIFCGTPVIGNLTGDLHKYLLDDVTGIRATGGSVEEIKWALDLAHQKSAEQRMTLRRNAYEFACKFFSDASYVDPVSSWLGKMGLGVVK